MNHDGARRRGSATFEGAVVPTGAARGDFEQVGRL
jgi:hypothetical protein